KANWNIHVMARDGIRLALEGGLRQAGQQTEAVELPGQVFEDGGHKHLVDIVVQGLSEPKALAGMLMIVFRDRGPLLSKRRRALSGAALRDGDLALQRAREEAQALREEMRAQQEELQASNEELQSTNEELQSTNEELTSSKEEMQSMNEELQAVNTELLVKLDDLALAQSDMTNLLNSTEIATLFLDMSLNVRRFTETSRRIFTLRDNDVGRPISDLACTLDYPSLLDDIRAMLQTLQIKEKQVEAKDGQWYTVRIMPYRALDGQTRGAVITFVNITIAKQLEAKLRAG
ncbi:MAG: PAS domain-containing protein, partial [Rubrivivax sp.]|nr:PAS domain-containing protein [Rubrivivax sp.]